MARPRSETPNIVVHRIDVRAPNGTIYVEDRTRVYDPDLGRYRDLGSKRVGKRDPITKEIVPCRPRRTKAEMESSKAATRKREKTADILNKVGEVSGIDEIIHDIYPLPIAQKTISLAHYCVQTDQPINHLESFQLLHDLPYRAGLSVDMAHHLIEELGEDEGRMQQVFKALALNNDNHHVIAFDSTSVGTYSQNNEFKRHGFNKDGDGLETFKITTFYSLTKHCPISFEIQPGNIPDIISLNNAIVKGKSLGMESLEFVVDNGFISQNNIASMCDNEIIFTGMADLSDSWVKKAFKNPVDNYTDVYSALTNEEYLDLENELISCVQKEISVTFNIDMSQSVRKTQKIKKDYKLYLSFYFDQHRTSEEQIELKTKIYNLAKQIRSKQVSWEELKESERRLLNECYEITTNPETNEITLTLIPGAINNVCKHAGIFCIVSNQLKPADVTLKLYRMRSRIEDSYGIYKSTMDGKRPRTGKLNKIRGKEFCKMLALCYQFRLQAAINNVKNACDKLSSDDRVAGSLKKQYEKLHKWLSQTPLRDLLNWFDCIETVVTENKFGKFRWDTETIKRDNLFLEMLFEELENSSKSDQQSLFKLPIECPDNF